MEGEWINVGSERAKGRRRGGLRMQFLARHDAEYLQSQPSEARIGVGRGSGVQSRSQPHGDSWQHKISSLENKTGRIKRSSLRNFKANGIKYVLSITGVSYLPQMEPCNMWRTGVT